MNETQNSIARRQFLTRSGGFSLAAMALGLLEQRQSSAASRPLGLGTAQY